jgi:hypothetical protein
MERHIMAKCGGCGTGTMTADKKTADKKTAKKR